MRNVNEKSQAYQREIHIDVKELLAFYDHDREVGKHAKAIKEIAGEEICLALLRRYFEQDLKQKVEILPSPCTTGKSRGFRLDAWIKSSFPSELLYQVEVKTWSSHSIGGNLVPSSVTDSALREFKVKRWDHYWDGTRFREDTLNKVLTPMKVPAGFEHLSVEPLACLWDAMHPEGAIDPFFRIELKGNRFPAINVFSVSAYLRMIADPVIALSLPLCIERLRWLEKIFPKVAAASA